MSLLSSRPVTPVGRSSSITRSFGRSPSPHSTVPPNVRDSESAPVGTPGWRKRVLSHRLTFQRDNASAESLATPPAPPTTADGGPKDLVELEQLRASIQSLHQQAREARARRRHSVPPGDELLATFSQPSAPVKQVSILARNGSVRRKAVPVCDLRILDPVTESEPCPMPVTALAPTFERGFPFSKPTHIMDVDAPALYSNRLCKTASTRTLQPIVKGDDELAASPKATTPRKSRGRKRVPRVRAPTPPRRVSSQAQFHQQTSSDETTEADSDSMMSRKSLSVSNGSIPPRKSSKKIEHVVTLSPSRQLPRRASVHSLRTRASTQSFRSPSRAPPMPANSSAVSGAAAAASEEVSEAVRVDDASLAAAVEVAAPPPRNPPPRPARRRLRTSSSKIGLNGKATPSPARPRTADSLQTDDDDAASFWSATWDPATDEVALDKPSSPSCSSSDVSSSSSSFISSGHESRPTSAESSLDSKPTIVLRDCFGSVLSAPNA